MKNIGIIFGVVILVLIGMSQYESYKLNKTANDAIETMQNDMQTAQDRQKAKNTVCLQMNDLKKRFDMFRLDSGSYPSTKEGIEALIANPDISEYPNYRSKPYLTTLPKDPWGNSFSYANIGNSVKLTSFGADGLKGGDDADGDIRYRYCR